MTQPEGGTMSDIECTDLVTVRRDDLLAMESEIKGLKADAERYLLRIKDLTEQANAAYAPYRERVEVFRKALAEMTEARDAAVLVANIYQAQADAEHERAKSLDWEIGHIRLERDNAVIECRKRKGWEQDIAHWKERAEDAEACIARIKAQCEKWPVTLHDQQVLAIINGEA